MRCVFDGVRPPFGAVGGALLVGAQLVSALLVSELLVEAVAGHGNVAAGTSTPKDDLAERHHRHLNPGSPQGCLWRRYGERCKLLETKPARCSAFEVLANHAHRHS